MFPQGRKVNNNLFLPGAKKIEYHKILCWTNSDILFLAKI